MLTLQQQQLVLENIPLAVYLTKQYTNKQLTIDDLIGAAYLGLCEAAQRWSGEGSFANYATRAIRAKLWEEYYFLSYPITFPYRRTLKLLIKIIQIYGVFYFPTREEIKKLGHYKVLPDHRYFELYNGWRFFRKCIKSNSW